MTNLDTMAPILTPQKVLSLLLSIRKQQCIINMCIFLQTFTHTEPVPSVRSTSALAGPLVAHPCAPGPDSHPSTRAVDSSSLPENQPISLSGPQLTKLQHELGVVEGNMSVLSEMLAEMSPGQEKPADLELLRELYATCRAMQQRLVELVDRVANDEITAHLLKLNDDLNNLFLR